MEFDAGRNTRYCGQISDLLHLEEIQRRINRLINDKRKDVYCDIYFQAE